MRKIRKFDSRIRLLAFLLAISLAAFEITGCGQSLSTSIMSLLAFMLWKGEDSSEPSGVSNSSLILEQGGVLVCSWTVAVLNNTKNQSSSIIKSPKSNSWNLFTSQRWIVDLNVVRVKQSHRYVKTKTKSHRNFIHSSEKSWLQFEAIADNSETDTSEPCIHGYEIPLQAQKKDFMKHTTDTPSNTRLEGETYCLKR